MTQDERLVALEKQVRNLGFSLDMVLNYCRSIAQAHLSAERIAEIERLAGNGHDTP